VAGERPNSKVHLDTYIPKDAAEREALSLLNDRREQFIIIEQLKKLRDVITGMNGYVKRGELDHLAQKIRDQQKRKA